MKKTVNSTALLELVFEMMVLEKKSISRKKLAERIIELTGETREDIKAALTADPPGCLADYKNTQKIRDVLWEGATMQPGAPVIITRGGRPGKHQGCRREIKGTLISWDKHHAHCRLDQNDPKSSLDDWSKKGDVGYWGLSSIRPDRSRKQQPLKK